jgi:hypothetical protein
MHPVRTLLPCPIWDSISADSENLLSESRAKSLRRGQGRRQPGQRSDKNGGGSSVQGAAFRPSICYFARCTGWI